jgi:ParB family chromosome partitioning protein
MGHARALAGLADPMAQKEAAELVLERSLSVRETEAMVARMAGGGLAAADGGPAERRKSRKDPNVRAAEEKLKRAIGTEVRITGGPEKGRIVIEFVNAAELQRLFEMLQRAARSAPPPPADPRTVSLPGRPGPVTEGTR